MSQACVVHVGQHVSFMSGNNREETWLLLI